MTRASSDPGAAPDGNELLIGEKVPDARAVGHGPGPPLSEQAERRAVRQFAARVLIFLAPLLAITFLIEALLWRIGETWPLERVIRTQEINPQALFSRRLIDQGTFRYKYLETIGQRPSILVLGSSRLMQFRREMFGRQGASFYNAGGMIHSIEDINAFLDRLPPNDTPQMIILGIDFWWLNANTKREANDAFSIGVGEDGTYSWQGHANVLSFYLRNPSRLGKLFTRSLGRKYDPNAIGLQAAMSGPAFRRDGSKKFSLRIPKTSEQWQRRLPPTGAIGKLVLEGGTHFAFTDGVSIPLLEQLRTAVLRLRERNAFLIAYSAPVINEVARVAATAPRQREFWKQYHQELPALFRSLDIPYYDIITPEQLGLDDRYMRDPYHPHDTFNMYVLQAFCEDPKIRLLFPDVANIARLTLASPRTNPLYLDLSAVEDWSRRPGLNR